MALPKTLCLFPVYRARAVYEHQIFFSAHTQNGKLADREEIFSEFWIIIVDYTFKHRYCNLVPCCLCLSRLRRQEQTAIRAVKDGEGHTEVFGRMACLVLDLSSTQQKHAEPV